MSEQHVAMAKKLPTSGPIGVQRFLFADPIGFAFLGWVLVAFVLRPLVMDAHAGIPGAFADVLRSRLGDFMLARVAGALQVASVTGLLLVLALGHVRLISVAPDVLSSTRNRFLLGFAYAAALCISFFAFVWTPVTAVSLMLHDTFIFYDAIHRIDHGQRPSADFPTALGAASLYLPWIGSKIAGGYAGAIEISSIIVAFPLCVVCAYACASRYGGMVSAVLVAAIFLIVVPSMLEGYVAPESVTFENGSFQLLSDNFANAMFYNRWGWGALIAVFAFLTPREKSDRTSLAETIVISGLLAFVFWLKLSYFVAGFAAAVLYSFLGPRSWRTLSIGAAVTGGLILLVGFLTGNLFAYIRDNLLAGLVSGGRTGDLASLVKANLLYMLIAMAPLFALGLAGRLKRADYAVAAVILCGTLFVVNQNAQTSGLPTLLVAPAHALWRLRSEGERSMQLFAILAFAMLALTYGLDRTTGMIGQVTIARREEVRPATAWSNIPALKNVFVQERESMLPVVHRVSNDEEALDAFRTMAVFGRRQYLRSGEYLAGLQAGMADLAPILSKDDSVVVMDFCSPLAFLMNARPAKGYWISISDSRTISETVFPAAAQLFADADHVMLPKIFVEPDTALRMLGLYGTWLDEHYAPRIETTYWTRWSRQKTTPPGKVTSAPIPSKHRALRGFATQH